MAGLWRLRSSTYIHDWAIFLDRRDWVMGQSIKDAARPNRTLQRDDYCSCAPNLVVNISDSSEQWFFEFN